MTHTDFNHILSSLEGLTPEQMRRLRQQLDRRLAQPKEPTARTPRKAAKRPEAAPPGKKTLTADAFNRQLLAAGRLALLPDPALDLDDDDPADAPVPIQGEPLSETIFRERR